MRPVRSPVLVALLAVGPVSPARAGGVSADVELVRPTLSEGSLPGVDSPLLAAPGTMRAGLVLQYEQDPVILVDPRAEVGAVVGQRQSLLLAASWDLGRRVGVRASLPLAAQWGTEVPEYAREGLLVGDAGLGVGLLLAGGDRGALGMSLDAWLPTSSREAWMGEESPRGALGLHGLRHVGALDLLAGLDLVARNPVNTDLGYTAESQLAPAAGLRWWAFPERIALGTAWIGRHGLDHLGRGGAENTSEWLTTLRWAAPGAPALDLALGKGIGGGVGSTAFRALVGLTWTRHPAPPPPPPPPPEIWRSELPEQVTAAEPEPEAPVELARVEGRRILIREPIRFAFATDRILPESRPVLESVAALLEEHPEIEHVVIEGHASEEGSWAYNYELSERRARAVWEALIEAGVHPDRMSYRGMGETVPVAPGRDEASLARNRRVEFHIVRQAAPGEPVPELREGVLLPWSGEPAPVRRLPPKAWPTPSDEAAAPDLPGDDLPDGADRLDPDRFLPDDGEPAEAEPAPTDDGEPAEAGPAPTDDGEPPATPGPRDGGDP